LSLFILDYRPTFKIETNSFASENRKEKEEMLAQKHPHPRDAEITFEEGPHIYTIRGDRGSYTSCTTFVHQQFSAFDADAVIDKMMAGKQWTQPTYKYYGMTRDAIKAQWDAKREASSGSGTQLHYDIECFYNDVPVSNESVEYSYFLQFQRDWPLCAYRTEWMVFYEEYKLCGSIDMVCLDPDSNSNSNSDPDRQDVQIYDWKRCQEIVYENPFGQTAVSPCLAHMPDTNFWHYAIQLNVYRKILQDKYQKRVTALYLVCLHPDNWNRTYQRIEIPFLDAEIEALFAARK